ncbi:hypothetical protein M422DRAFT_50668 [Sphaerobolus stellatus SS14]|uniref:Uncharacterized protein n=1 Tax=Sphaerobolus stellatus (strain SS14) TaxID=990650 RepID=A0A0C9VHL9_SPHS4|nr:hypothetical protein M422DRAFT_50668 [Sphaerobolus stellatus SS14]
MSDAAAPSSAQTDNATSPGFSATPLPPSSEASTLAHIDDFDFYASENDDIPLIIKGSLTKDGPANNLCGRQLHKRPSPVEKVAVAHQPVSTQGGASSKKRTFDHTKAGLAAKRARIAVILSEDEAENVRSGEEEIPEEVYQKILDSHERTPATTSKACPQVRQTRPQNMTWHDHQSALQARSRNILVHEVRRFSLQVGLIAAPMLELDGH